MNNIAKLLKVLFFGNLRNQLEKAEFECIYTVNSR